MDKQYECPYCKGNISRPEEKKTDVNISVRMIEDCVRGKTDVVSLVSADSDLIPPLEMIRRNFQSVKIKVYFPPSNSSLDIKDNLLHRHSKPVYMIKNLKRFQQAVMPDNVTNGILTYNIPPKWKAWQSYQP